MNGFYKRLLKMYKNKALMQNCKKICNLLKKKQEFIFHFIRTQTPLIPLRNESRL